MQHPFKQIENATGGTVKFLPALADRPAGWCIDMTALDPGAPPELLGVTIGEAVLHAHALLETLPGPAQAEAARARSEATTRGLEVAQFILDLIRQVGRNQPGGGGSPKTSAVDELP